MRQAAQTRRVIIGAIFFAFVSATATAGPAEGDTEFTRAATAAVERIEREDGFTGVILVARGDQVLLRKAAGFADRERNIPNTPETKFPLASVTKQFTAAAIMLLVQDGKVSLDDQISKYYPASPPAWSDVRIKHLLTHGSGIDDYWVHRPEARNALDRGELFHSPQELIDLVSGDPLLFEPGTGIQYSNTGYELLTAVIEHVSNQSYAEFLQARIFTPLAMNDTGRGSIPGNGIRGYIRSLDGVWSFGNSFDFITATTGAGGLYSTIDDMLLWSRALQTDEPLSATSRATMFTDYGYNYGFGWRLATKFGRKLIWHTGGGGPEAFAAIFDRFPEEQLTVLLMTNNTGLTSATATLLIDGKVTTFPANAARKLVEQVEQLYFGRVP